MKFLLHKEDGDFSYEDLIKNHLNCEVKHITSLPQKVNFDETLIIYRKKITDEIVKEVKYSHLKYILITEAYNLTNIKRLLRSGGGCWVQNGLPASDAIPLIIDNTEKLKVNEVVHFFSHNELEMFRVIARAFDGEKTKLSDLIFGVTSESTFDVNLSRLRKKLKDPETGKDFFRIITKKGRLYLVNNLNNYEVIE